MSVKGNLDELQGALTALLTYANGVTGASDVSVGDAIHTLGEGYGQGGGGSDPQLLLDETVTFTENAGKPATGSAIVKNINATGKTIVFAAVFDAGGTPPVHATLYSCICAAAFRNKNPSANLGLGSILRPAGTIGTDSGAITIATNLASVSFGNSNYASFIAGRTYRFLIFAS